QQVDRDLGRWRLVLLFLLVKRRLPCLLVGQQDIPFLGGTLVFPGLLLLGVVRGQGARTHRFDLDHGSIGERQTVERRRREQPPGRRSSRAFLASARRRQERDENQASQGGASAGEASCDSPQKDSPTHKGGVGGGLTHQSLQCHGSLRSARSVPTP